jgi:hypothetical protein
MRWPFLKWKDVGMSGKRTRTGSDSPPSPPTSADDRMNECDGTPGWEWDRKDQLSREDERCSVAITSSRSHIQSRQSAT